MSLFAYFHDKAYQPFLVQSAWMDMFRISWKWSYFISDTIVAADDSLQNDNEPCVPKIDFASPHPLLLDAEKMASRAWVYFKLIQCVS